LLCMVVPMIISLIALITLFTLLDYCATLRFNSLIMGPIFITIRRKTIIYNCHMQLIFNCM
jgi:hypothetical protein